MNTNLIYECSDHRDFLSRYLKSRKSVGGLRALARKAGFKSPGHLTMMISGERKLTTRSAELLADALTLKGRKRALILAFAKADSARTEREREKAREEVLRLKSLRSEHQISAKQFSFLGTWYYPVLFVLLHQDGIAQDFVSLARRLGRGLKAAAVQEAIRDLETLGLIELGPSGRWNPKNAVLTTPEDVRNAAIGKYHRNSLVMAEEALELPMNAREFNGLTVAVPERLLPDVKEKIRRFRSELNDFLAHDTEPADVYQLNLHLFPLTTTPDIATEGTSK